MFTYNYSIIISPSHDAIFLIMFKNIFIGGNIKIRVCRVVVNTKHGVVCANVNHNNVSFPLAQVLAKLLCKKGAKKNF